MRSFTGVDCLDAEVLSVDVSDIVAHESGERVTSSLVITRCAALFRALASTRPAELPVDLACLLVPLFSHVIHKLS
jgi:hypothetical protein